MPANQPSSSAWARRYISIDRSLFDVTIIDESSDFLSKIKKAVKTNGQLIIEMNTKPWREKIEREEYRPYSNPFRPTWLWPAEISSSQIEIRPLIH